MDKLHRNNQSGVIIPMLVGALIMLSSIFAGLVVFSNYNLLRSRERLYKLAAFYGAESGIDHVVANFNNGNTGYAGTGGDFTLLTVTGSYKIVYSTTVSAGATTAEKQIVSVGKVYIPDTATTPKYTEEIAVLAKNEGGTVSTSMLSTGIIQVSSNVNITGKGVFVNRYLEMTHPNAIVRMEELSVADYKVGSGNCSTGPDGELALPAAITSTTYRLGGNNCADDTAAGITVLENQSIEKVGSLNIPLESIMTSTTTTACTTLTTGTTVNNVNGHYPSTGSGVVNTCGSSGTVAMSTRTYNITDHVHIRGNLCTTASPCNPTFNNTSGSLKYVFVEGTINFQRAVVTSGSPIVFVSYSAQTCCSGSNKGAIYFSGTSAPNSLNAPLAYFIASKGDLYVNAKVEAMGGAAGSNIFVNTTGGGSHGIPISTTFPYGSVPVDYAWRVIRYNANE